MPAQVAPDDVDKRVYEQDQPIGEPQAAYDERGRDVFDGYSYYGRDSDSIRRFDPMDPAQAGESAQNVGGKEDQEEDETLTDAQIDKPPMTSAAPSNGVTDDVEPLASHASSSDVSAINESVTTDSDNTLSSLATISTQPTTVAADSPAQARRRQSSSISSSHLEPVSELHPVPLSTEVVLEESEDLTDGEWDLLEAKDFAGFSRNGGREATLFSKGIRDKYRLAVAPLASPLRSPSGPRVGSRIGSRKGSLSSAQSSVVGGSVSTTPEPPRSPSGILRFASARHRGSKAKSRRSLSQEPSPSLLEPIHTSTSLTALPGPSSPRPPSSNGSSSKKHASSFSTSSFANTNSSIRNFARTTFLPQKASDKQDS